MVKKKKSKSKGVGVMKVRFNVKKKTKPKVKKLIKHSKKELQIEFAKQNLKNQEEVYNNNLEAIAEYCDNLGMRVIRSENLKDNTLKVLLERLNKDKISFSKWLFGDLPTGFEFTELQRIEEEIKHIEELNKWAEHILKNLNLNIRKKIAKDIVENMSAWNRFSNDLSKLTKK